MSGNLQHISVGRLSAGAAVVHVFCRFPMIVNFSISKQQGGCRLSTVDNSTVLFLCPRQCCNVALTTDSVILLYLSTSLHHLPSLPAPKSLLSGTLIDIFLLTFSFTLTLMCAALSDAQVVWSFIRPHSLLYSFPLGYSSLLPVL